MSKYVPRFMKASQVMEEESSRSSQEPRRWGAELKPVVNTSLPAKLAPKLEPVTLASATSAANGVTLAPISIKQSKPTTNVTSMEDFPSLGGKKFAATSITPKMSFAELSRNWADKQKEEETAAKLAAEEQKRREFLERELQAREAKQAQELRKVTMSSIAVLNRKKVDSDDEKYFEEDKGSLSDEPYVSDEPVEEVYDDDEEDDEYVNDGTWDSRKHRDELY